MDLLHLSKELKEMYQSANDGETVAMIHVFGIKFAKEIKNSGVSMKKIAQAAGIKESYATEISKGVKLSKFVVIKSQPNKQTLTPAKRWMLCQPAARVSVLNLRVGCKEYSLTPETMAWLSKKVPEFSKLGEDERKVIYDFSFLWSLFEGSVLNCHCNIRVIKKLVSNLEQQNRLAGIDISPYVEYLQHRYYLGGSLTCHYHHLHVERSGNPAEVVEMLSSEDCSNSVKLIGCLVVVFRLRNNLFHGEKWRYRLQGQLDNFQQANEFLRNVMDCLQRAAAAG